MKAFAVALSRLYRLGLGWGLLVVDLFLLIIFSTDVARFLARGYNVESLYAPLLPIGGEFHQALALAAELFLLSLLLVPFLVASFRIIITHFQLGQLNWPLRRVFSVHAVLSLLLGISIVTCSRMQVASGKQGGLEHNQIRNEDFVYTSHLREIPVYVNNLLKVWVSDHLSWHHIAFAAGVILLGYLTGRVGFGEQRTFLRDYMDASKLADYDPRYLPEANARSISALRYAAPYTAAVSDAVDRELAAYNGRYKGNTFDHDGVTIQVRQSVLHYLFSEACQGLKSRLLPDVVGAIYVAVSNEPDSLPLVLSASNHTGINDALQSWFGAKRRIHIVGCKADSLQSWREQQDIFLQELSQAVRGERALVVLPLVSKATGQIYDVRELLKGVRTICPETAAVLDASFVNVTTDIKMNDLWEASYMALSISQWITSSESCGILCTGKTLIMDPDWERKEAVSPNNIRTISALFCALQHAFEKSPYCNDPKVRSRILIERVRDIIDGRLSVIEIPGLDQRSYFLSVEPARGRIWASDIEQKLKDAGLGAALWESGGKIRVTLSFPPYVDFWRSKRLAVMLAGLTEAS